MKTLFAIIGVILCAMAVMGMVDVADFRLFFVPKGSVKCERTALPKLPESP